MALITSRVASIDQGDSFYGHEKTRLFQKTSSVDIALYNVLVPRFATKVTSLGLPIR